MASINLGWESGLKQIFFTSINLDITLDKENGRLKIQRVKKGKTIQHSSKSTLKTFRKFIEEFKQQQMLVTIYRSGSTAYNPALKWNIEQIKSNFEKNITDDNCKSEFYQLCSDLYKIAHWTFEERFQKTMDQSA